MFRKFVVLSLASLCVTSSIRASDEAVPSVDDAIAKYIEAIGGKKAWDAVKTMRMSGKMVMGGGMEAPMTMEFKRPGSMRMEFTFQGMTATQGFDGENGWFVMPFMGKTDPEKMPPDMAQEFKKQADIEGPLLDYKKKGHTVEMVGADEFEGTPVYKLKVTHKEGDVEYYMLDKEYFIPLGTKGSRTFQGMPIEYEVIYGDYKEVGGLMMPHSIQQKSNTGMDGGGSVVIEKIEVNADIDDSRFAMPEKKPEEKKAEEEKPD